MHGNLLKHWPETIQSSLFHQERFLERKFFENIEIDTYSEYTSYPKSETWVPTQNQPKN